MHEESHHTSLSLSLLPSLPPSSFFHPHSQQPNHFCLVLCQIQACNSIWFPSTYNPLLPRRHSRASSQECYKEKRLSSNSGSRSPLIWHFIIARRSRYLCHNSSQSGSNFPPWCKVGPYQSPWGPEKLRVLTLRSTGKVQKSEDPTGQLRLITFCLEKGNCPEEQNCE